jgi:hypothetical protein
MDDGGTVLEALCDSIPFCGIWFYCMAFGAVAVACKDNA